MGRVCTTRYDPSNFFHESKLSFQSKKFDKTKMGVESTAHSSKREGRPPPRRCSPPGGRQGGSGVARGPRGPTPPRTSSSAQDPRGSAAPRPLPGGARPSPGLPRHCAGNSLTGLVTPVYTSGKTMATTGGVKTRLRARVAGRETRPRLSPRGHRPRPDFRLAFPSPLLFA